MTRTIRSVALALVGMVVTGYASQTPAPHRPWPPVVQPVAVPSPALAPADALRTFALPPGFRIELVAAEPLVQDPILMDWDPAGRLWVVELPGYMRDITAKGELDPVGRVVVLEDVDGDGTMDRRTVFADRLIQPRALTVLDRGVLVGESPDIWLLRDTNGDLRADTKERVTGGFGRREANVEINANSLHWSLDNRLHAAGLAADLSLRLRNGAFAVQPSLSRGQWGVAEDDAGRLFRNHNESPLHVDLVPTPYYARNPNLLRTRGSHERLGDPDGSLTTVWPAHQTPGTNRAYQYGILRSDKTLARYTAACAPVIFVGDRLPGDLYGNAFVAEPAANLVSRFVLSDDGTTLRAAKAYTNAEFLTSTDERFRPVHLANAPDGTLYIADMYRGVIQHGAYVTEYLRGQILSRQLEQPTAFGRIYRIVHDGTARAKAPAGVLSTSQLVGLLSHGNGWWRQTAQRTLVERGDRSAAPALAALAATAPDWRTRVRALWTLEGLDALDPASVLRALSDPSRDVRVSALRLSERWLGEPGHVVQAAVLKTADDGDWAVRQQYAATIGALSSDARVGAAAALLTRLGSDPIVVDAALSGLGGEEAAVLERLLAAQAEAGGNPPVEAALTMLAATIVRGGADEAVQRLFVAMASPARLPWQRAALLGGAEIALLGAEIPGLQPEVRRATAGQDAPCPTCPGGRGGPGGGYAFPAAQAAAAAAGRAPGARAVAAAVALGREPVPLSTLAAQQDETGTRAAKLLTRLTWPGKASANSQDTVVPLTPEQQRQFEAGREVYTNICVACHGPDGQGVGAIGAPLVGSTLVPARAELPIRILLHGKEGEVGLMPPVGGSLSDEQIAAALTYIRREWGGTATAVDPATVATVRTATAGRTKPWTREELLALPE